MTVVKIPELTERIYTETHDSTPSENKETLRNFLLDYAKRKKGKDMYDNGFHGGIIIMPDRWAAKFNEDDGKDFHTKTNMNLVRYLNNDNYFKNEGEASSKAIRDTEVQEVMDNNIIVSLLSDKYAAKIVIFSYNNQHSPYQLHTVKDILDISKELVSKYEDGIEVGFFNKDGTIEAKHYTLDQKEKIESYLNKYEREEEIRTSLKH